MVGRPIFYALAGAALMSLSAQAPAQALSLSGLLGDASDSALTKLSQPGAFYTDEAVRILLPGPLKQAAGIMKFADRAGLTTGLTKSINDAAGIAAGEAKPIFRSAIQKITIRDAASILRTNDGGSRYLNQSAGSELRVKLRPLILSALGKTGAFTQLDKLGGASSLLGKVGVSRDGLTDSVTDQAMNGIFNYMGKEEARVRANPLGAAGGLLKALRNR